MAKNECFFKDSCKHCTPTNKRLYCNNGGKDSRGRHCPHWGGLTDNPYNRGSYEENHTNSFIWYVVIALAIIGLIAKFL